MTRAVTQEDLAAVLSEHYSTAIEFWTLERAGHASSPATGRTQAHIELCDVAIGVASAEALALSVAVMLTGLNEALAAQGEALQERSEQFREQLVTTRDLINAALDGGS